MKITTSKDSWGIPFVEFCSLIVNEMREIRLDAKDFVSLTIAAYNAVLAKFAEKYGTEIFRNPWSVPNSHRNLFAAIAFQFGCLKLVTLDKESGKLVDGEKIPMLDKLEGTNYSGSGSGRIVAAYPHRSLYVNGKLDMKLANERLAYYRAYFDGTLAQTVKETRDGIKLALAEQKKAEAAAVRETAKREKNAVKLSDLRAQHAAAVTANDEKLAVRLQARIDKLIGSTATDKTSK